MNSGLIRRPVAEIESVATHFPAAAMLPIRRLPATRVATGLFSLDTFLVLRVSGMIELPKKDGIVETHHYVAFED